jgi:hypothetical protein
MSKKLVFMIPTSGRDLDDVAREAWAACTRLRAAEMRLVRCQACGEYRGSTIPEGEGPIAVSCLCDGIICTRCKTQRIHRPISNYFSEVDGQIWHVPYFKTLCSDCITRHNAGK